MKIETKFDLDQRVWMVVKTSVRRIVACNVCVAGKLKIGDEEFVCPKCQGQAGNPVYAGERAFVDGSSTIGKIEAVYYSSSYARESPVKHSYMLKATGVGSGTVWEEDSLFATEKEAQDYCDKWNGVLNFTDEVKLQN